MINNNGDMQSALKQLRENVNWFLLLGIGLVVLGVLAIVFSYWSTILSVVYLGAFLLAFAVFEAVKSFKVNKWSHFFLHVFLSVLYAFCGLSLVLYPAINALTLTLVLAAFFAVSGVVKIVYALTKNIPHKGWLVLNGALAVLLGVLIWMQWPSSGLWVIGMFVGLDAVFTGLTWIMLSVYGKTLLNQERR